MERGRGGEGEQDIWIWSGGERGRGWGQRKGLSADPEAVSKSAQTDPKLSHLFPNSNTW